MTKVPFSMMSGVGTAAQLDAGTDPAEVPQNSDLGSAAYIDTGTADAQIPTNAQITAWDFESAEITLGASDQVYSAAHGLGAVPSAYMAELVCKTAEHGFSVGDRVLPESGIQSFGGSAEAGFSIVVDATNIAVNQFNTFIIMEDDGTPQPRQLTPANWKLVLKARK